MSGAGAGAGAGAEVKVDDSEAKATGLGWSRPIMNGVSPPARGGHSAALVGNLLVIFGGHFYSGQNKFSYLNDVWAIDVDTMTWHNPRCAGHAPAPRYGHSATVVDYKMYVFGGKGEGKAVFNDVWCLDVERWAWVLMPSTTAPPPPRFQHSELAVGGKIVYFGGWDGRASFNDLWVYDTEAKTWIKPKVAGPAPSPRHGHSSELTPDGRVLIHGGWTWTEDGSPKYSSDTRQLDTETMIWGRCRVTGDTPESGRAFHGTCMMGDLMLVFGGYTGGNRKDKPAADTSTKKMTKTRAAALPPQKHKDLYLLDTVSMEWLQPEAKGLQPSMRYGHSVIPVGSYLLMFGGWDGSKSLNDVVQLDMTGMLVD